jgi:hypothetical protein
MSQLIYCQVKSPQYPLDRRLVGPQSQSACGGEEKKKSHHCPMIELHWLRLVVCVDINVLDKNMNTKKITETLLDTSKKISLEIKREK